MDRVNEQSTSYLTATFTDGDGEEANPTTVQYRVDCLTTGSEVRDWTPIGAAAQVEITLTSEDNVILNARNREEIRFVTIEAVYGEASDKITSEHRYAVRNLRYL